MSNTERKAVFEKTSPSSCFLLQKVPAPPFATFFIDIRSALSNIFIYWEKSKSYPWALKTYTVSDCKTIESVLAIFLPRSLCVWLEMISK